MNLLTLEKNYIEDIVRDSTNNKFTYNVLSFKLNNKTLYNELKTLSRDEMIDDYGNSDDINLQSTIIKDISLHIFNEFAAIVRKNVIDANLQVKSIFIHIYIEAEMSKFIIHELRFNLRIMFNQQFWNSLLMSYTVTLPLNVSQKYQFILYTPINDLNRYPYFDIQHE
ncbi:hypothetical protein ACO0R3_001763 [Hanseniaspora guilliermondii]